MAPDLQIASSPTPANPKHLLTEVPEFVAHISSGTGPHIICLCVGRALSTFQRAFRRMAFLSVGVMRIAVDHES